MFKNNSEYNGSNLCLVSPKFRYNAEQIIKGIYPNLPYFFMLTSTLRDGYLRLLIKNTLQHRVGIYFSYDLKTERYLLFCAFLVFLSSREKAWLMDMQGRKDLLSWARLLRMIFNLLREIAQVPLVMAGYLGNIHKLQHTLPKNVKSAPESSYNIIYLKTDRVSGLQVGGSVSHTVGVVSGFKKRGYSVQFISSNTLPYIEKLEMPVSVIKPAGIISNLSELAELEYSRFLIKMCISIARGICPRFVYQRYSLNNYTGALLSRELGVPFVLEYNGSFPWMYRNWGSPLLFEKLANKIEIANLKSADLVVVVSQVMKDELLNREVNEKKVLVNPNGVDTELFHPEVSDKGLRKTIGFEKNTIVGFVGTFGPWHGAEVLAHAIAPLVKFNSTLRFLWIGEGDLLPKVRNIVGKMQVDKYCIFLGTIPSENVPQYLAACDILVAPHVPNPDGSRFFGSPTKLFEYMAMGKAIVASNLEQIGEVLKNGVNALLVKPSDSKSLVDAILQFAGTPSLRARLGMAASKKAMNEHSWEKHVKRILDALEKNLVL